MHKIKELSDEQIYKVIKEEKFDDTILKSNKNVAIVMSQSWCPQWQMVSKWLLELPEIDNLDIYQIIYDEKDYYEDFLAFKENVLGNYEVPYIRYYIDGKLVKETNVTSKMFFLDTFETKKNTL